LIVSFEWEACKKSGIYAFVVINNIFLTLHRAYHIRLDCLMTQFVGSYVKLCEWCEFF